MTSASLSTTPRVSTKFIRSDDEIDIPSVSKLKEKMSPLPLLIQTPAEIRLESCLDGGRLEEKISCGEESLMEELVVSLRPLAFKVCSSWDS